jgi:hypothetical protein
LEDPVVDGRIISRWIFRKWDVGACTGSIWLRIGKGQVAGTFECGNEPSCSINCRGFLDELRTGWLSRRTVLHGVSK